MIKKADVHVPRILFSAPSSGSGKTMVTCGILEILRRRGVPVVSFKCGPDYIDLMFHQYVLGVPGYNLDSFFLPPGRVKQLFAEKTAGISQAGGMAVVEGVMGYYDGVGGTSTWSSTYEIAGITQTPVVLVVDGKSSSLSTAALVKGFLEYRPDSRIAGVVLNRVAPTMERRLRPCLEELGIRCFGFIPEHGAAHLDSRHLGLAIPGEQEKLKEKIGGLADLLEQTLDIDGICRLAGTAGGLSCVPDNGTDRACMLDNGMNKIGAAAGNRRIGVARDEAFCFYYRENLDFLEADGWTLVPFSPIHDSCLPGDVSALLLGGGYPECYARELSENVSMLEDIRNAANKGVRILAECGGFLYLHRTMEGMDGGLYPMAGVIGEDAYRTGKLSRFGYVTLRACNSLPEAGQIRGHEFHYWDSTDPGHDMRAEKPLGGRSWSCMHRTQTMLAGFPHLYYPSNPWLVRCFLCGGAERGCNYDPSGDRRQRQR